MPATRRYYPSQEEMSDPQGMERVVKIILDTLYTVQDRQNQEDLRSGAGTSGQVAAIRSSSGGGEVRDNVDRVQLIEQTIETYITGDIDAQLNVIRDDLQARGTHPLYIGGLAGETLDPQFAKVEKTSSFPASLLAAEGELKLFDHKLLRYDKSLGPGRYIGVGASEYSRRRHTTMILPGRSTADQVGGGTLTTTFSSATSAGNFTHFINASSSHAGWDMPYTQGTYRAYPSSGSDVVIYYCRMKLDDDNGYSALRYWFGLSAADGGSAPTTVTMMASDTPAVHYACFRLSTNASDTEWQCVTDNGSGAPTVTGSGVGVATADAGTEYELEIHWKQTKVEFFINNIKVATSSSTLPGQGLGWVALGKSLDGTSRGPLLNTVVIEY